MSIDEHGCIRQTVESDYMKGWHIGAMPSEIGSGLVDHYRPKGMWSEDMQRGYADGHAACLDAERAERERLERCPTCRGIGLGCTGAATKPCPDCHGTGRRP